MDTKTQDRAFLIHLFNKLSLFISPKSIALDFYFFSMWHGKEMQSAADGFRAKINLLGWGGEKIAAGILKRFI